MAEYRHSPLDFLTRAARDFGDVVPFRLGPRNHIYLVSDPHLIEDILVTHSRIFIKFFALRFGPLVFGNGLLTSEGDVWLRQRRLIQPAFHRDQLAAYGSIMPAFTERMLSSWRPGQTRDIHVDMMRLTLEIAAKTLFDADAGDSSNSVGVALEFLQEKFRGKANSFIPLPDWVPTPQNFRLWRVVRQLNQIIYGFIHQRRQSGINKGDLLSRLLDLRDEQNRRMTDRQVRDEAVTLFLAGHETTALALSWAWYLLASNPQYADQLAAEVDEVLGSRTPTVEDLPHLRFTERVVLETLRLYPPAYLIGREALQDCTVGGYHLPRRSTLITSQWVVHRDPRWFDEPDEFRPNRWAGNLMQQLPKYAYFPFGGGPRVCIGNTFAMMETVLVLATIAQRFRFTLLPGLTVTPKPAFTLRPVPGIQAIITPRENRRLSSHE